MKKSRSTVVFIIFMAMLLSSMTGVPLSSHSFYSVVNAEDKVSETTDETEASKTDQDDNQKEKAEEDNKKEEEKEENEKQEAKVKTKEEKKEEKTEIIDVPTTLKTSVDDVRVTVTFDQTANLPKGTTLTVKKIVNKHSSYREDKSKVEKWLKEKKTKKLKHELESFDLFDISLMYDGKEVEPEGKVTVKLSYENEEFENKNKLKVLHFVKDQDTDLEEVEVSETTLKNDKVTFEFETESFSKYGVVEEQVNALRAGPENTIQTADSRADGITMNLFDYYGEKGNYNLNQGSNVPSSSNYSVPSNYQIGINNGHRLQFTAYGVTGNTLNHFTGANGPARTGIVQDTLNKGYPVLTNNTTLRTDASSLKYLFDTEDIEGAKKVYRNVNHLMTKDANGVYSYNSNVNYAYYDTSQGDNGSFKVYNDTYNTSNNDSYKIGFFPFTEYDSNQTYIDNHTNNTNNGINHQYYNHHFGMHMNATFAIPTSGKVNGKDVVYEYSGDDDMWLYIDGILVLDIGGIHEPVHGTINFTTGKVVTWPQNDPDNKTQTTLEAIFSKHGITWKNDTDHTLDMFYLERGGQYSNLQMTLNIPITKTVSVKKEISGELSDEYLNKDFSFIAYVDKGDGNMVPYEGMVEIGKNTTHITDGKFKIKPTEIAKLLDMKSSWKYKIVETGMNGTEFSSVVIIDSYGNITHNLIEGEDNQSASSDTHEVEQNTEMRVKNVLREEHGDIKVGKKWRGDDELNRPSEITFQLYRVKNGDESTKELYKSSDGHSVFTLNTENWNKIFTHLLRRSGKDTYSYIVQEVSVPQGYVDTYSIEETAGNGMNIFITNTKYGNVDLQKKWEKADGSALTTVPDHVKVQLYQYRMKGVKTTIDNPTDPKRVKFVTTYKAVEKGIGSEYSSATTLPGDYTVTNYVQKNGSITFTIHSFVQSFGVLSVTSIGGGKLEKVSNSDRTSDYYKYYHNRSWKPIVYETTYKLSNVSDDVQVKINMIGTFTTKTPPTEVSELMDIRNVTITNPTSGGTTDVYNVPTPPTTMPDENTEGLVKYGDEIILNNANSWKNKVDELPLQTTINGEIYYYFYYVKEVDAPAGFTVSYEGNNGTGQSIIIKNIKDYFPMSFKKVDSTNNAKVLEGAVFSLYKDEDCEQIVEFYKDENMQQATTSFTTDSNGTFTAYGLKAGTYYLKEVSAPSGYYLIDHPLKVTMDLQGKITVDEKDKDTIRVLIENSNATDIIEVKDSPVYYLPNSGGIGTHIFTMLGTAFIALAVTLYIVKRRDEEVKAS